MWDYIVLMRWHRPIGTLLLLWPALMALFLASPLLPAFKLIIIFSLGAWVMRSAGCVINDYADRSFDGHVARTQDRPLAVGRITPKQALVLFVFLIFIAFALVCMLNIKTIMLSFAAVFLAILYPFSKRWISMPQVILGAAFAWAIPMAYSAQDQPLDLSCWLLFSATLLWAVAYDTLYAMVDKVDDLKIGLKSTAILFGAWDKFWIGLCHALMLMLLGIIGSLNACGGYYFLGILSAGLFMLYQQGLIVHRDPQKCFKAFLNNQWVGAALFAGVLMDKII
jgi:4-hydroxybenzoate polyprenyltransferase